MVVTWSVDHVVAVSLPIRLYSSPPQAHLTPTYSHNHSFVTKRDADSAMVVSSCPMLDCVYLCALAKDREPRLSTR